jgi:hypothetical protein
MPYYKADFEEEDDCLPIVTRLKTPAITEQELKYKIRDSLRETGEESCEHCIDLFIRLLKANDVKQLVFETTGTLLL